MKAQWTHELLRTLDADFASIQEHFRKNIGQFFCKEFSSYTNSVIPAVQAQTQNTGMPKGGLAQLISLKHRIKSIRVETKNYRLQAQILKLQNISLLWINSYFPTDPQTMNYDSTELSEVLAEVERILDSAEFDHVLWNGDLNWDPRRRSGFSVTISTFMERIGLVSAWDRFPVSHTSCDMEVMEVSWRWWRGRLPWT